MVMTVSPFQHKTLPPLQHKTLYCSLTYEKNNDEKQMMFSPWKPCGLSVLLQYWLGSSQTNMNIWLSFSSCQTFWWILLIVKCRVNTQIQTKRTSELHLENSQYIMIIKEREITRFLCVIDMFCKFIAMQGVACCCYSSAQIDLLFRGTEFIYMQNYNQCHLDWQIIFCLTDKFTDFQMQ